ncbi:MAG: AMP-binding protein [Pseudomonadota bacterium]
MRQTAVFETTAPELRLSPVAALAASARDNPTALCLRFGKADISYGDFAGRAAALGEALKPLLKTKRVGILGSRSLAAYIGIAGACWAGATYVPLNLKWPEERLIALMQDLQLDALVLDPNGAKRMSPAVVKAAPKHLFYDGTLEAAETTALPQTLTKTPSEALPDPAPRSADELAYIVFTSGSTGMPKGVMVTCETLQMYLAETRKWTDFTPGDRIAEAHDVTFDLSVHNMFLTWEAGASLHVMSAIEMMGPQAFIRRNDITVWMSVPTIVNTMRNAGSLKPGLFETLRLSVFCGEPLAMATVNAWAEAAPDSVIENIYGPTECTVVCTRQRLTNPPIVTEKRGILAIGDAYENFEITLRDADGAIVPDGETGEIVLKSPQLAAGYFNAPEQTAKAFRMVDGERHYFTGDLGMRDENGVFHHMGRSDNQVKLKGNRIELEEVEMHLRKASETELATVVAWPVIDGSAQGLVGFTTNTQMDEASIRAAMVKTLPEYMVPTRIDIRETLPRNINDKVDRKALLAELDAEAAKTTTAPPLSPNLAQNLATHPAAKKRSLV